MSSLSERSKAWLSGCSSPMPAAPARAQRWISDDCFRPPCGIDGAEGQQTPGVAGCGVDGVVIDAASEGGVCPAEADGNGGVDAGLVHGLQQLLGGGKSGRWERQRGRRRWRRVAGGDGGHRAARGGGRGYGRRRSWGGILRPPRRGVKTAAGAMIMASDGGPVRLTGGSWATRISIVSSCDIGQHPRRATTSIRPATPPSLTPYTHTPRSLAFALACGPGRSAPMTGA